MFYSGVISRFLVGVLSVSSWASFWFLLGVLVASSRGSLGVLQGSCDELKVGVWRVPFLKKEGKNMHVAKRHGVHLGALKP